MSGFILYFTCVDFEIGVGLAMRVLLRSRNAAIAASQVKVND
ncbi:MAG: hypothetical protein RID09_13160 [Coleofasciculus sp. G1-WW12-02]